MVQKKQSIGFGFSRWGAIFALACLLGVLATDAQAMLLTLNFSWEVGTTAHPTLASYYLQENSIIQVIGFKEGAPGTSNYNASVSAQFEQYGTTTDTTTSAQPFTDGHVPSEKDVYLVDTTQPGHSILYTGNISAHGSGTNTWYGLYTQIAVDDWLYDRVYIRVFGATSFDHPDGTVLASYWGISGVTNLSPVYQTQEIIVENLNAPNANYFEVIPEPATVGLLGLGACALAAWRRRRAARGAVETPARREEGP